MVLKTRISKVKNVETKTIQIIKLLVPTGTRTKYASAEGSVSSPGELHCWNAPELLL